MSLSDLAVSSPSSAEWDECDFYEPAISAVGSRTTASHSKRSAKANGDGTSGTDLDMAKVEVKAPTVPRSGLLATQLKR